MNKSEYADIEWSKKLGHLFPDANYWIDLSNDNPKFNKYHKDALPNVDFSKHKDFSPLISAMMALTRITKTIIPNYTRYDMNIRPFTNQHLDEYWEVSYVCKFSKASKENLDCYVSKTDKSFVNAICKTIEYLIKEGLLED